MTLPGRSRTIVVEPLNEPAQTPEPAVPAVAPEPAPARERPAGPAEAPEEVPA
jgi:hypothetical protein